MQTKAKSDEVLRRLALAKQFDQLAPYAKGLPDRDCPEVHWSIYGLTCTHEIVVIAKYKGQQFAASCTAPLVSASLFKGKFRLSLANRDCAGRLADELWPLVQRYLRPESPNHKPEDPQQR